MGENKEELFYYGRKEELLDCEKKDELFYKLIPCSESDAQSDDEIIKDKPKIVEDYQSKLLEIYGYKDCRANDQERIFYSKVHFILAKHEPNDVEQCREALMILLTDRGYLFGEKCSSYLDEKLNHDFYSEQRKICNELRPNLLQFGSKLLEWQTYDRIWNTAKCQWETIVPLKWDKFRLTASETERNIQVLPFTIQYCLDALIEATCQKKRMSWWLYRKNHVRVTKLNRVNYEEQYTLGGKNGKIFDEKSEDCKKWIEERRKKAQCGDNIGDIWLLDLAKCGEEILEIVLRSVERIQIYDVHEMEQSFADFFTQLFRNQSFCEDFLCTIVVPYMYAVKKADLKFKAMHPKRWRVNQKEYDRQQESITRIEGLILGRDSSVDKNKSDLLSTIEEKCCNNLHRLRTEKEVSAQRRKSCVYIARFIRQYSDGMNQCRRKKHTNLTAEARVADGTEHGRFSNIDVVSRVQYYLSRLEKLNIPKEKWPVALLMIIHLHGRQFVLPSSDIKYRVAFRKWISQDAHDWERLEQLRLLQKLCKVFDLNDADCVQNYKEYIMIWGDRIESKEEYNFWNRRAESILSNIPGIQVQIELYKCWKKCLCPITETLSYTSASYLHKGGYKRLYKTKGIQEEIDRIIASEENEELFQKSLGEYQARLVCSNRVKDIEKIVEEHFAKIDSAKISELINQCGLDEKKINRNKGKDKDGSEDEGKELERLLTESVFRKILWNKARKKLADQVKRNLNIDFTKMEKSLLRGESL